MLDSIVAKLVLIGSSARDETCHRCAKITAAGSTLKATIASPPQTQIWHWAKKDMTASIKVIRQPKRKGRWIDLL
jgi:hypothetical protein